MKSESDLILSSVTHLLPCLFVSHDIYRVAGYRPPHPLSIGRIGPVTDICWELGWLTQDNYRESTAASDAMLAEFHDPDYVAAVRRCSESGQVSQGDRERYNLGSLENPVFPLLFERAAQSVGGSVLAARLAMEGRIVYHPAGGTHHGRPNRASGFCYFNDPVFAIREFLKSGLTRVAYVDLDAHHGDGVEEAFIADDRVLCMSVHEAGRWPGTGQGHRPTAFNYPVPAGFSDGDLTRLLDAEMLPALAKFGAQAVVITCGADGLAGDPLSRLAYSNGGLWSAVERVVAGVPAAVVLGGGGYNPWTTVRCWSGLWARLAGNDAAVKLPESVVRILTGLSCELVEDEDIDPRWFDSIADTVAKGP
jgi:acetoin utilization protein AcuC